MSSSRIALTIILIESVLLAAADTETRQLKQRVAALERRTAPLDRLCAGSEDDFYEAFFRLVQEQCEKGGK